VSKVAELQALVEREGYTEAQVAALKMLADAGLGAESAAQVLLVAHSRGVDPIVLARAWIGVDARKRWGQ
jgi:hypothetical protein